MRSSSSILILTTSIPSPIFGRRWLWPWFLSPTSILRFVPWSLFGLLFLFQWCLWRALRWRIWWTRRWSIFFFTFDISFFLLCNWFFALILNFFIFFWLWLIRRYARRIWFTIRWRGLDPFFLLSNLCVWLFELLHLFTFLNFWSFLWRWRWRGRWWRMIRLRIWIFFIFYFFLFWFHSTISL